MAKLSYYEQHNAEVYEQFNEILTHKLPYFCNEYFNGIDMKTSVLTKLNYARDLAIFFDFLLKKIPFLNGKSLNDVTLKDLDQLESSDIEYYLRYLSYYTYNGKYYKNAEKAKARKLSSVRSLFKYFYNKDKLSRDIASKVATPKLHEKPIIRLDDEEVETMLDSVESAKKFGSNFQDSYNLNTRDRDIAIISLLLSTGIRVSELVGLNTDDIDYTKRSFRVTRKGGNISILYYPEEIDDCLENYLEWRKNRLLDQYYEEPALFISLQNKRIGVRAVENVVKKFSSIANPLKSVSPHKLRSTFGTALYRETKDIYVVAEVLGHKDVNTTKKHYAATSEEIKRSASEKVKLRKKP